MRKGLTISKSIDPARSAIMRAVRAENTKPELLIRGILHGLGYRYRLHDKDLPGKPDIIFAGRRKVVFVHDCFWHGHDCYRGSRVPKTNREYWVQKIIANRRRDDQHIATLTAKGWQALVIWECEISKSKNVVSQLICFLDRSAAFAKSTGR